MDMIKFFGKVLLLITVPVAFVIVSSLGVSSLIAIVSYSADNVTYNQAFDSILPVVSVLMTIIGVVGLLMFFVTLQDRKQTR
jgi:hypothetical protein